MEPAELQAKMVGAVEAMHRTVHEAAMREVEWRRRAEEAEDRERRALQTVRDRHLALAAESNAAQERLAVATLAAALIPDDSGLTASEATALAAKALGIVWPPVSP